MSIDFLFINFFGLILLNAFLSLLNFLFINHSSDNFSVSNFFIIKKSNHKIVYYLTNVFPRLLKNY